MKLRSHLLLIVLAVFLPLALLGALLVVKHWRDEREAIDRGTLDTVRALSTVVDLELQRTIAALEVLATSESLTTGDVRHFYERLQGAPQHGWDNVIVFDAGGRQLMNLKRPFGAPLPAAAHPELLQETIAERRPTISNVFQGPVMKRLLVAVEVPVVRNDTVPYVLVAVMLPERFERLLYQQRLSPGWIVSIVDRQKRFIASSRGPGVTGEPGSPTLVTMSERFEETTYRSVTVEGVASYSALKRSAVSGWTVAIAIPATLAEASLRRSVWTLGGTSGAVFVIAALIAGLVLRRLSRGIHGLEQAAAAVAEGRPPAVNPVGVLELDDLGQAFVAAADALRSRDEEFGFTLRAAGLVAFDWDIASGTVRQVPSKTPGAARETTFDAVVEEVHPDDRDAFVARVEGALRGESEYGGEFRRRRSDGSIVWRLDKGRVVFDEAGKPVRLAGVALDITAQKRTEAELERRRREAEVLADLARTVNASQDLETILPAIADGARALCGCDAARVALLDPERNAMVLRYTAGAPSAMPPGFVIEPGKGIGGLAWARGQVIRSADFAGDPRFGREYLDIVHADHIASCMVAPIRIGARVEGLIYANNFTLRPFTVDDEQVLVTLAEHAAVALRNAQVLAREQQERAAAEAASRTKDEFLAMLGHELRNPLGAIHSAAHLLQAADEDPALRRRSREIIARQAAHLARLVDDLLDSARVATGKIALERRPLDLGEVAEQCVSALTAARRTEGREVVVEARPAWISGDATRAEQIVMNLMTNALKFTPAGGRVTVRTGRSGDDAVLTVEDTGAGIPPALLPRVFDLFVQGERSLDRAAGGLGIGLTLVRRLVELHGVTITASSGGPGRGSTFTVRLRAIQPPAVRAAHGPAADAAVPRAVLVVDDNADAREMLRTVLTLAGHTVYEAEDGPGAVDIARAKRPDVAFVDIGLPGFDGYEVARRIRAQGKGGDLVLVALTGYGQLEDREQALAAGFDRHLTKPVAAETLTEILSAR